MAFFGPHGFRMPEPLCWMLDGIWPSSGWNEQQTQAKNIGPAKVMGPGGGGVHFSIYISYISP